MDDSNIKYLDAEIRRAARKINVLNALSWPAGEDQKFLDSWHAGHPLLPNLQLRVPDLAANVETLDMLTSQCNQNDPAEKFLAETAQSYADAGRMITAVGTPAFTRFSTKIYGRPDAPYKHHAMNAVDSAKFFLEITTNLLGNQHVGMAEPPIHATDLAQWLQAEVDEFFDHDTIQVVVDEDISARALACGTRIRLRGTSYFSQFDKDQLLYHEAFVHTATHLNGKKQANLTCLGLATPRTTRAQEGIAVLAELATGVMDINRLRRIALRVIAVNMALAGADFIDVFVFFLTAGQSERDAVHSAQRIFRGGAVKGQIVFTKDAIYLQGLMEVHTFFRVAIRDNRPDLIHNMFAGRLTMADALRLSPLFENGWLSQPVYIPIWARDLRRLSALMAYSAFATNVRLDDMDLERVIDFEEEQKAVQNIF